MSGPSSTASIVSRVRTRLRAWRGRWAAFAILIAFLPVAGMFSTSQIYGLRDLSIYYWPKYRWLRATIFSGQMPWWDPFMSAGQSAAADAMSQLFFLPTLLLRLAFPERLGFNLWVGLPYPLAALGMYLFARRHLSRQASAVAAVIYAVSGPVVSTSDFPNVSWSAMAVPWVLWAVDECVRRPAGRALVSLAFIVAAQVLAGEPVTMTATMVLALGYAAWYLLEQPVPWVARLRAIALVIAGIAAGGALSAVQLLPLMHAARLSPRNASQPEYFWSQHPLSFVETIAPSLFGDTFQWIVTAFPWMRALGSGRDPFFFSIYCGVTVFALAVLGLGVARRRWAGFWGVTLATATLLSLGKYTPVVPWLQETFSVMHSFRFPPKYLIVGMVALAMLAAYGWQALAVAAARRTAIGWRAKAPAIALPALLAIAGYGATLMSLLFRDTLIDLVSRVAIAAGVSDLPRAVGMMIELAQPHGRRLLLVSVGTAFLLWVASAGRRESRLACVALMGVICADLVATNAPVNIMTPLSYLESPEWVRIAQQHPSQRFYFAGRLRGSMDDTDIDGPKKVLLPGLASADEVRTMVQGTVAIVPSQWGIREALSYDLPMLFPLDYELVVQRFERAPREQRLHFLDIAGVRDCVMAVPPHPGAMPRANVPLFLDTQLYECDPAATRVRVLKPWALVEPDIRRQIDLLLRPDFDAHHVVLLRAEPPAPAGTVGPPVAPFARFTKDANNEVDIDAGVGAEGGFLVLADTFDDDWHVEVDGQPAPVLRANAIYRAVRLVPGQHTVRFRYRPRFVYYGGGISLATAAGLGAVLILSRRRRPLPGAASGPGDEISSEGLPLSVPRPSEDGRRVA
jgi:hypothetical protein